MTIPCVFPSTSTATEVYRAEALGWVLEDRLKRPSILLSALGGSGELAGLVLGAVATTRKLAALSFDAEADRLMEEWRSSQPPEKSRKMMRK